jgi:hypothetical protein
VVTTGAWSISTAPRGIRFISLDSTVSNGYETWMWDGRGHTGLGDVGLIVQMRPE